MTPRTATKAKPPVFSSGTPGIYRDITNQDYHAFEAVSNSYLGRIAKCPAAAKLPWPQTSSMMLGEAAHTLVLMGQDTYNATYAIAPVSDRRTKEFKAFAEANAGKVILSIDDHAAVQGIYDAISCHPFAASLIENMQEIELSALWLDGDTLCKGRADALLNMDNEGALCFLDLKTTKDSSPHAFARSCLSYGYYRQAAWYIDGFGQHLPVTGNFYFIAIETAAPFRTAVYKLNDEAIEFGRQEYKALLAKELDCREWGLYPAYANSGCIELGVPAWASIDEGEV